MSNFSIGVMGEVAKGKRGVSYKPEDLVLEHRDEHFRLLTAGNIQDGITTTDSYTKVSAKCVSPEQQISPDDILVCMSNGSKRLVGKSSRLRSGESRYCVGAFCSTFSPVSGADPDYVFHLFQSEIFQRQVQDALEGSAINNLKNSMVESFEVPIPLLPEQKKIAEILSGIDRYIDRIAIKVGKCKKILQGIFVELDQIENQGSTARLGEIVAIQNGYAFPSKIFTEERDGIPLIRISNIQHGVVDLSKSKKIPANFSVSDEYKIHKGDILISMSGATTGKIGISCSETICLLNQRVGKFSFQGSDVTNEFMSQLLLSGYLEHRFLAAAAGGAQPNISDQGIEALQVPLPDELRQSNLSRAISGIRNLIASENKVTAKHLHLKKALASDLLSGRKRVSV